MSDLLDRVQQRIADYAYELSYGILSADAVHAAKVRVIDTLGVLVGGFFGEPCRIARDLAARTPDPRGATVIGTGMKTSMELAAFVNGATARYTDMNDNYNWPGSSHGHPSDTLMPILAVAEHAQVNGREFITAVVLAYEVFLRISDVFRNRAFDTTNFACLATAVASGKLLALDRRQISDCIALAVTPCNILKQVRLGSNSMFKGVASGQAGRAGVFAAILARAGMEGPHLPFEGEAGWCKHVAGHRFTLDTWGGDEATFKILDTRIKLRPANASAIATILAAEKIAPLANVQDVRQITVEVNQYAKNAAGTGERPWNADTRESADHSIPYVVAAALIDGTVTVRSYSDARLRDLTLRALMRKIEVIENSEFTKAYGRLPVEERARVTVQMNNGQHLEAESGGDGDDLSAPKSDAEVLAKFRTLSEEMLATARIDAVLRLLWGLEEIANVAEIPPAFAFA